MTEIVGSIKQPLFCQFGLLAASCFLKCPSFYHHLLSTQLAFLLSLAPQGKAAQLAPL